MGFHPQLTQNDAIQSVVRSGCLTVLLQIDGPVIRGAPEPKARSSSLKSDAFASQSHIDVSKCFIVDKYPHGLVSGHPVMSSILKHPKPQSSDVFPQGKGSPTVAWLTSGLTLLPEILRL